MPRDRVRIGIIGVGNCARALLEGISYYRARPETTQGLMFPMIGPYAAGDVEPVAAWDVDVAKVGRDLWTARELGQNLHVGIDDMAGAPVGQRTIVQPGPVLDGTGPTYAEHITLNSASQEKPDIHRYAARAAEAGVDVLVNYLPVGSQAATEFWAEVALAAGCGFVNNIPVFIARRPEWRTRFTEAGLPLLGDDIKSQLGATYLHRLLARAFADRGVNLTRTYQLNVGGNMDFLNMLDTDRLSSKRKSKTSAVTTAYDRDLHPDDVHIGPSDYVKWLGDTKKAFVRCEGQGFAGAPLEIDAQITVPDSPNSAGVVIDAVRVARLAIDRRDPDATDHASAWLFKAPPEHAAVVCDSDARAGLETWIHR